MTIPLFRLSEIRRFESSAQAGLAQGTLMLRAGTAAARLALQVARETPGPVLVLAGPGNNGGDALVAARLLHEQGIPVEVALLDAPRYRGDALLPWEAWRATGAPTREAPDLTFSSGLRPSLILDGLFGIGLNKPLPERAQTWIARINASGIPILALDIPSGLNADTGMVMGCAIRATHTLTFLGAKPGLYTADGPDHCGKVIVDALDVPCPDGPASGQLNDPALFAGCLKPRARNSHKGQFGNLAVVGGNTGMVGAALLAARTGLHLGAGRIYVRMLGSDAPAVDVLQPELMFRKSLDGLSLDALTVGPGMGDDATARGVMEQILAMTTPVVLDADALNILASERHLFERLPGRGSATILTPHPLEAARLLATTAQAVQADRIAAALELARRSGGIVVLKGAGSVIAHPDGRWIINPTGNPGLATGGTGDVLAGAIGALCAQGWPAWEAALGAVWIHGRAADEAARTQGGPIGMTASELPVKMRVVLNRLIIPQDYA